MKIIAIKNTPAATPLRPVFKGNRADLFKRNVTMERCGGCRKPGLFKNDSSVSLFK